VGIVDRFLGMDVEIRVLLRQCLVEVLLVADVLRRLVGPEAEGSASTLHDDVGTQAAEDTRLVVFAGVEVGDDGVVRVEKL
jgi:hypothetical protein